MRLDYQLIREMKDSVYTAAEIAAGVGLLTTTITKFMDGKVLITFEEFETIVNFLDLELVKNRKHNDHV